jgi:molybdopterin molybdotransferase
MDGFAVRAADVADATTASPRNLRVVADIPAGSHPTISLAAGEAARIMTGAPIPNGADAVVPVEDTDFDNRDAGTAARRKCKFSGQPNREGTRARVGWICARARLS